MFIVDDITGEKVGTATISLLQKNGYDGAVDWVAIKKYQWKNYPRPLISKFVEIAKPYHLCRNTNY